MPSGTEVLIIGNGSMGQHRHRIIKDLRPDWNITTVDPVGGDLGVVDWLNISNYGLAFVCTPPASHAPYLMSLIDNKIATFVEKPICLPLQIGAIFDYYHLDAKKDKTPIMVGHNLLWHKDFQKFKAECNHIGKLVQYTARYGNRLTNWDRENKDSYSRYRAQGGGVLLDCFQDIDLALEITGGLEPRTNWQLVEGNPITVDSEYTSYITACQPGSNIHAAFDFDYLRSPRIRRHTVLGTEGEAEWVEDRGPELDQSYIDETEAFIKWVETGVKPGLVPDPFRALEFIRKVYQL